MTTVGPLGIKIPQDPAEIDASDRPGLTTDEKQRIRELERENFELRRANEILKSASAFFGSVSW
jgi:transposase-like protein